jgi:DNA replication and repair protein RecF
MYLSHLTLQNYRNYPSLDLTLAPGVSVFAGDNAQGKTNLLEAIYLLATTRTQRSSNDSDLVRWEAAESESPVARLSGKARRRNGDIEITIAIGLAAQTGPGRERGHASKRLLVNGVPRRASDVVGQIAAVLFTAQDIELLTGPPALRRRYLDITISQVNPLYLRSLQRYSRIVLQRNSLLRRIQEGAARTDQLGYWDEELCREAVQIFGVRAAALGWLAIRAAESHARLSGDREALSIAYQPQLPPDVSTEDLERPADELRAQMCRGLASIQRREIAAGVSLYGPHRDDMLFSINGAAAGAFGSRAQQRTAALALRLAETGYIENEAGDKPILLLDDILSELDARRRGSVLETLGGADQMLITTTEAAGVTGGVLGSAHRFGVLAGQVMAED